VIAASGTLTTSTGGVVIGSPVHWLNTLPEGSWLISLYPSHEGKTPDPALEPSPEEVEAAAILERVERELDAVEKRTERLMYQYGL
jgi:hypothetical protein